MKKVLPIGNDSFVTVRESDWYYADKTLMIKDFVEFQDTVALITRPRRFGKTMNLTMLQAFFDISKDNRRIFDGLNIMNTEHAALLGSRPVVFFSFKNCTGKTKEELRLSLIDVLAEEYIRFEKILDPQLVHHSYNDIFYQDLESLKNRTASFGNLKFYIKNLVRIVSEFYQMKPMVLMDEYDQPILSSYENNYREELTDFFSVFYGSALKGNEYLGQALLTGIQRVAKESIFSKLNNMKVYTVIDKRYSEYFGLTEEETSTLLKYYGLELNEAVKQKYDGYLFYKTEIYNPWSILNYVENERLENYWINTSTNGLIHDALKNANRSFLDKYDRLIENGEVEVGIKLETSFIELKNEYTLWGMLVNSGYLTIFGDMPGSLLKKIRIPNEEVKSEFQVIVAEQANISPSDLELMFEYLLQQDMSNFLSVYEN